MFTKDVTTGLETVTPPQNKRGEKLLKLSLTHSTNPFRLYLTSMISSVIL